MKKQILRSILLLVILAMVASLIPFNSVEAANPTSPKFTLSSAEGTAGSTVTVEVKLNEDTVFEDLTLAVDYDSTKLAVESEDDVILGDNVSDLFGGKSIARAGRVEFQAIDANGEDTFTIKAGKVLTINFKILEGAQGTQALSLKYDTTYTELTTSTIKVIVPITGITLNKTAVELNKGEKETLSATISPENTTENKTITWTSSDNGVATVTDGVITAVGTGTATITATVGDKSANCTVTVKSPMTGIELSQTQVSLVKGQTKTLELKYIPEDTTDSKNVTWQSSDSSVVTVENGVLKALKAGNAKITATVGNYTAEANVTVIEYPLEGIALLADKYEISINETTKINVITNPENTTDELNLKFISSNEKVAIVDENGVVTGISAGNASITVIANEEYSASVTITVTPEMIEENDPNTEETPETPGDVTGGNNEEEQPTENENTENEEIPAEENTQEETTSVLPKTADIAIGTVLVVMVIAAGVAIFAFKKNKKLNK